MQASKDLQNLLKQHLTWHATRLDFAARFILALIHTKTVNLVDISLDLNGDVKPESNYRRIQRFFKDFTIDSLIIARLMLLLLPTKKAFVVVMDRTNWRFGKLDINILMVAIAHNGVAFPVVWTLLPKAGNSNTQERIELMEHFLSVVEVKDIKSFLADREFVGRDWFAYLLGKRIPFHIRIRQDALRDGWFNAFLFFHRLPVGQSRNLHHRYLIFGHPLAVTGVRLADDYLIVVTNTSPKNSMSRYALRWRIESFFAAVKVTGFDVEATHLNKPERIDKLLSLVAIAFCWAHLVGEWLHGSGVKPLKFKAHGRRAKSFFRLGLDHLRCILNHVQRKYDEFSTCINIIAKRLDHQHVACRPPSLGRGAMDGKERRSPRFSRGEQSADRPAVPGGLRRVELGIHRRSHRCGVYRSLDASGNPTGA